MAETGSVAIFSLLLIVGVVDPRQTRGIAVNALVCGFDAFLNVDTVVAGGCWLGLLL